MWIRFEIKSEKVVTKSAITTSSTRDTSKDLCHLRMFQKKWQPSSNSKYIMTSPFDTLQAVEPFTTTCQYCHLQVSLDSWPQATRPHGARSPRPGAGSRRSMLRAVSVTLLVIVALEIRDDPLLMMYMCSHQLYRTVQRKCRRTLSSISTRISIRISISTSIQTSITTITCLFLSSPTPLDFARPLQPQLQQQQHHHQQQFLITSLLRLHLEARH